MAANSIAAVIEALNTIVNNCRQTDSRAGYFAALYKKVTMAVAHKIEAGYFDDGPRMEKLDIVFANRYLQAYHSYIQGQPCSQCWQLAFDACKNWQPMVMHHLLMGMNAHIGLDLGIAAGQIAPGQLINSLHNDFNKINQLLAELIEEVKTCLYSLWPLSKYISNLKLGTLENNLAGFSMTIARDAAWQVAQEYAMLQHAWQQAQYITVRDSSVAVFSHKLLHPGAWLQTATAILKIGETGTVAEKITRLDKKIQPAILL
jgi:hypothetical protein